MGGEGCGSGRLGAAWREMIWRGERAPRVTTSRAVSTAPSSPVSSPTIGRTSKIQVPTDKIIGKVIRIA